MGLYAQADHRTVALRQYRVCMRVLEEELGVGPSEETTVLYQRIRAGKVGRAETEASLWPASLGWRNWAVPSTRRWPVRGRWSLSPAAPVGERPL